MYDYMFYIFGYIQPDDSCFVQPKHVAGIGYAIKICVSTDFVFIIA